MASASLRPFIEPGISISVKTTVMSRRASSRRIASLAFVVERGHADKGFVFDDQDHLS